MTKGKATNVSTVQRWQRNRRLRTYEANRAARFGYFKNRLIDANNRL